LNSFRKTTFYGERRGMVIPFKKAVYESIVEQFGWIVDSDVK
jgi:hypothetical protein